VSKPRVLFVARTRYRLPLELGLARKWDALAAEFDLRVIGTAASGEAQDDGRFRLVAARRSARFYPALVHVCTNELRAQRPDAVVAQSPYEAAAALLARKRSGVATAVVLEVHGDWGTATRLYGSRQRRLVEPASRRVAAWAVRHADAVRTVSPFTTNLVRALGVEPAATFTTFFDVSAFTSSPPAPLPEARRALFVGVLERYKNVHGLADAWRRVACELPDAQLRIVGNGREREVVEGLVRELPAQVSWTGRLEPHEVAAAFDEASLLVLPSFSEGLPRVVMEAFCRGRPVVASRAGGIPDIVVDRKNGLLVPPGNAAALGGTLSRALTDRALLERLAAGAAASAAEWVRPPEEFARAYRELVDGLRR
jgi:glycosyltransferase involved in cell wall biosynthesis